jgi:acetyl-CoA carboxylase carboxyl transferase subunit beta
MSWFKREAAGPEKKPQAEDSARRVKTEGLWLKCEGCKEILWKNDLEANLNVCPKCGAHSRIDAALRLQALLDGPYQEFDADLSSSDPLEFVDQRPYYERLATTQQATSLADALISAAGTLDGRKVQICAMEPKFIGGSMGCVMGEKITRAIERSISQKAPLIIISASGGARMQEGAISLMQMAKISAALMRLDEERIPYISVLTDPTTGGVTATRIRSGSFIHSATKSKPPNTAWSASQPFWKRWDILRPFRALCTSPAPMEKDPPPP